MSELDIGGELVPKTSALAWVVAIECNDKIRKNLIAPRKRKRGCAPVSYFRRAHEIAAAKRRDEPHPKKRACQVRVAGMRGCERFQLFFDALFLTESREGECTLCDEPWAEKIAVERGKHRPRDEIVGMIVQYERIDLPPIARGQAREHPTEHDEQAARYRGRRKVQHGEQREAAGEN